MRYLFLAIILLIIDWFAFQAIATPVSVLQSPLSTLVFAIYWSIPVLTVVYAFATQQGLLSAIPKRVKVVVTAVVFILYFSKLLTGTVILLDDLRRIVAWLVTVLAPGTELLTSRMPLMSKIGIAMGGIPAVLLIYGLLRNPYRYKVFRSDIGIANLPAELDGLRIVQISDIHTGSLMDQKRVQKSVEMINALDPDLVFFTGDLVNNTADEAEPYIPVFKEIKSRYGVFSIVGNHDYGDYIQWPDAGSKHANFEKLKLQHAKLGWDLLLNSHRSLQIRDRKIGIIGVENYSANPRFQKYGDMAAATHGMGAQDLMILLSHDPSHWEAEVVKQYPDVALTLSGHTHGFQFGIELGKYFKWSPVKYMYRQWAGLYCQGAQYLYVNRGLGFLGYPGRVGILPEVTFLTLRSKSEV
jgi:predicted MPP superfamily phosphohydrolase